MSIIAEIHNEVKTAYLKEVADLQLKIDAYHKPKEVDQNKLKALDLGFSKFSSELIKIKEEEARNKEITEAKNRLMAIKEYAIKYPTKKFISAELLGPIIDKYKLVIADPSRFIGEMPKQNLEDIANFNYPKNDLYEAYAYSTSIEEQNLSDAIGRVLNPVQEAFPMIHDHDIRHLFSSAEEIAGITAKVNEYNISDKRDRIDLTLKPFYTSKCGRFKIVLSLNREVAWRRITITHRVYAFDNSIYKCRVAVSKQKNIGVSPIKNLEDPCEEQHSATHHIKLKVIATPDQFYIGSHEEVRGGVIVNKQNDEEAKTYSFLKDDPIVLLPVQYGFIVITAWGDEKTLPEIFNSTDN